MGFCMDVNLFLMDKYLEVGLLYQWQAFIYSYKKLVICFL
jgi:hypothetical protein